jgi:hypothetical protein
MSAFGAAHCPKWCLWLHSPNGSERWFSINLETFDFADCFLPCFTKGVIS